MLQRVLAVLVALGALGTAPSAALGYAYPGQQAVTAPVIQDLVSRADVFWAAHGVTSPACRNGPTVWVAPSLRDGDGDAWGRGDGATCELWLSDDLVSTIIDPPDTPGLAVVHVARACQAITHEDGHAHGLPHARRGVMAGSGPWGAPDPEPRVLAWAPAFCIRFAREWAAGILRGEGYSVRASREAVRGIR